MIRIPILHPGSDEAFPAVESALREPNGLLAAGGDLSPARLLQAYAQGIFPWFSPGEPILWWSPDPRMVFATDAMHVPRRLARSQRARRRGTCMAWVWNTMRGSGDHQSMGSPSENHGNIPWA